MDAKFSHLCQYVTRRNISVNKGRGSYVCNKAADDFGSDYYPEGAKVPTLVTMCKRHAAIWAKKLARINRVKKEAR
jgi:hypothetical protein